MTKSEDELKNVEESLVPVTPDPKVIQQKSVKNDPIELADLDNQKRIIDELTKELHQLERNYQEPIPIEDYMKEHIKLLHQYNEIKDIGQMLLGLCAEREGTTTKDMYTKFNLDMSD
ncbi:Swi5-domain-containing protein [Globomyces pollinis-pini]|nr:Swi5-domain-containing protein [Globomyces pollinis-pini]